jgi:hypothetical protein
MGNFRTDESEQAILNLSSDDTVSPRTLVFGLLEWNGSGYSRKISGVLAKKITISGTTTYVASGPIGVSQNLPVWQAKKISTSGADTIITWADGDSNFDNLATDLTALSYS